MHVNNMHLIVTASVHPSQVRGIMDGYEETNLMWSIGQILAHRSFAAEGCGVGTVVAETVVGALGCRRW